MEHSLFVPSLVWVAPFACLLVGIAIVPLAAPRFWESNANKLASSLVLGMPVLGLYLTQAPGALLHTARDYISFVTLLASLFIVSGGVRLDGDLEARPWLNTLFLGSGAVLASVIGTTGASMLLIRPVLHTNAERRYTVHTVVFFIFIVSNVGGCLTPMGDPPLFMGYLTGVPFFWTLRLAPAWFVANGLLLLIYFVWDTLAHRKEPPERLALDAAAIRPLQVEGQANLALLAAIVMATAMLAAPWRELAMIGLATASWISTPTTIRAANHFSFHPIVEVAAVFIGIFLTMIPALDLLRMRGSELGLHEPWHYFWASGLLSSVLDNTPTYLAFLAVGQSEHLSADVVGVSHEVLTAISLGSVFMGACTYIGNGPNFMVRAIAEQRGVKMPGFAGFLGYSGAVLIPVMGIVAAIFF